MTGFALKLIAICSMLLDHTMKVLPFQTLLMDWFHMSIKDSYLLYQILEPFGRLAFPIFAFFIAEGCRHTRSPQKYVGRLLLFGVISEVPFMLAVHRFSFGDYWAYIRKPSFTNVFFTLACGALGCFLYRLILKKCAGEAEKAPPKWAYPLAALPALALAVLCEPLHTDYGFWGVATILLAYALPEKLPRLLGMAGVLSALYLLVATWNGMGFMLFQSFHYILNWLFAMLALVLLYFYNGERGRPLKWSFYIFYPAHLTALYAALCLLFPQSLTIW